MIRNEPEFKRALARLTECHLDIVDRRDCLRQSGDADEQSDGILSDLKSRCRGLEDEIATYERRNAKTWVPAN